MTCGAWSTIWSTAVVCELTRRVACRSKRLLATCSVSVQKLAVQPMTRAWHGVYICKDSYRHVYHYRQQSTLHVLIYVMIEKFTCWTIQAYFRLGLEGFDGVAWLGSLRTLANVNINRRGNSYDKVKTVCLFRNIGSRCHLSDRVLESQY